MKKVLVLFVVLAVLLSHLVAFAEGIDLSAYDDKALSDLYLQIMQEIEKRSANDNNDSNDTIIMQKGSTGDDVKLLQQNLIALGFLSGNADGSFGNNTLKAIMSFQKANGLKEDGIVTQTLFDMISESAASLPAPVASYTAIELYNKFGQNKLAAEEELSGEEIDVTGEIYSIDSDMWSGQYYVKLAADSWGFSGVLCYFDDAMKSEVAKLQKGQKVKIRGTSNGAGVFGDPELKHCSIIG